MALYFATFLGILPKMFKSLIISLLIFISTGCTGFHWANDNWQGKDKAQHFAFSAAMAAAGMLMQNKQNMQHRDAIFGILFSVSLGSKRAL